MASNTDMTIVTGGGEETLAAMDEVQLENIGRSTYRFVKRLMQNPECRAKIKALAAEIKASGAYSA